MKKNIEKIYKILDILEDGSILTPEGKIRIFKIEPENILGSSKEYIEILYNSYLSYLKSFPNEFKIVITKELEDFNSQINEYKKIRDNQNNNKIIYALDNYISYLKDLAEKQKIYYTEYFLISKEDDTKEITEIINNLSEYGAKVNKIVDKEIVTKVLRKGLRGNI